MKHAWLLAGLVVGMHVGCGSSNPPEPPPKIAVSIPHKDAVEGAAFNKVFPASAGGYKLVFTQEKDGFAQADWTRDGKKMATISISDTDANITARDKFKTSSKRIAGHPAAAVGTQGTAVLVQDRFQVQVRSTNPAFTEADREALIEQCQLSKLSIGSK